MASTIATASSSGPAQTSSSTDGPTSRSVRSRLSGSKRIALRPIRRLAAVSTFSIERKFCSMRRRGGSPGARPSGSWMGGREKRRSNSVKAAKLAPRKR